MLQAKAAGQPATGKYDAISPLFKPLITVFILLQLLATAFWLMPQSALQQLLLKPLQIYMWTTGCDQNWSMFAGPNPSDIDVYMGAKITYQDGTQKTWLFPRMHGMGILEKYQQERFRKMVENAHLDVNSPVWPYIARFAAIANNKDPKTNPVIQVDLVRNWQPIPPPGLTRPVYSSYTFFHADYPPGSLPQ